jgi:hypothetical protein
MCYSRSWQMVARIRSALHLYWTARFSIDSDDAVGEESARLG